MPPGYASRSGWPTLTRVEGTALPGTAGLVPCASPYAPQRAGNGAFCQVSVVNSIPLPSRERRFESYRGGLVRDINSNTLTILVRHELEPVTCGNADSFRTLPPVRPRNRVLAAESPAQRRNLTTASRPLPCPEAVTLPPVSAATHRQPGQHGNIRGRLPSPPDRRQGHLADVLAWHRFGRFQLLVTAAVICCGDWPARRARAASRAAGMSAARMVASVRAYPAG